MHAGTQKEGMDDDLRRALPDAVLHGLGYVGLGKLEIGHPHTPLAALGVDGAVQELPQEVDVVRLPSRAAVSYEQYDFHASFNVLPSSHTPQSSGLRRGCCR